MNIFPTKLSVSLLFTLFLVAKYLTQGGCNCSSFKLLPKETRRKQEVHLFVAVKCGLMWLLLINNVDFYSICKTFRIRANSKPQSLEFSDLCLEFSMQASAQFSVYCLIWVDKGVTHVFQAALNLGN